MVRGGEAAKGTTETRKVRSGHPGKTFERTIQKNAPAELVDGEKSETK